MKRREEMTFLESIYLVEVVGGVFLTFGRLLRNLTLHTLHVLGLREHTSAAATVQYPNQQRKYPPRFRGQHRLTLHQDGSVKCTACFLCATACPAKCIYIEPAEHDVAQVEKFPHRYEIDTLLCIYCGYCVEACPVDAIRMDTGIHPEVYPPDPRAVIEDKEVLMQRSQTLDKLGSQALFEQHMQRMQRLEQQPFSDE